MSKNHVKVAVTGAAGQISYAFLFRLASGQVFGQDTCIDLHLLELEATLPALEGVVMELHDCAFPLLNKVVITSSLEQAMKDVNWAVLIGSVPRKAGMERSDLLNINGGIFTAQGQAINQYAADDVRVFVVGNPCNTNCLITMQNAPNIPADRFFAMTSLDENRACHQLAAKAGVNVADVNNVTIWGNHSASQYPDFHHATIAGQAVSEKISDQQWLQTDFIATVQQRGAAVIKARGASSAASAANAIVDGIANLVNDTPAGKSYSMCLASKGEYGVDEGLIFSFPCRTENGIVRVIEGLTHNPFSQQKIQATLDELRQERDTVQDLGLVSA